MRARRYTLAALAGLICLWAVAAAHAGDRVYWTDEGAGAISFANLNGSGGHDLTISGTTVVGPEGVVIDAAAGKLYWVDYDGNKISGANLDGSGGGDLTITGAPVDLPAGVAIDPAANRIYWANDGTPRAIAFAPLNGGAATIVNTSGAAQNDASFPALFEAPSGAGAPAITAT